LGDVQGTITSRCLERWAPGTGLIEDDDTILTAAIELVNASLRGDFWMIPGLLTDALKAPKTKGRKERREPALLQAATEVLAEMEDPNRFALWEALRAASRYRNPTPNDVALAFLRDA
jgi:hypothetical protein